MCRAPRSCSPRDALQRAAQLMWENDCGVVPVVEPSGRLAGIVTDRDLCMGAYATGRPLHELPVSGSMSRPVVRCHAQDPLEEALRSMGRHRLRRLPVVDDEQRLIGMLSMNDVVLGTESMADSPERSELLERVAQALSDVSRHRGEEPPLAARAVQPAEAKGPTTRVQVEA